MAETEDPTSPTSEESALDDLPILEPVLPLPTSCDYVSWEGFNVRLLAASGRAALVQHRLEAGKVTRAVAHRSVEALWYVVEGTGEVWRAAGGLERVDRIARGDSFCVSALVGFQVRAIDRLELLVVTIPPWPGPSEDAPAPGSPWQASED